MVRDQLVEKETFDAMLGDQQCEVVVGVGEDDPWLYVSLEVKPEDGMPGIQHMMFEFGICAKDQDFERFPEMLRKLANAIETNVQKCTPVRINVEYPKGEK